MGDLREPPVCLCCPVRQTIFPTIGEKNVALPENDVDCITELDLRNRARHRSRVHRNDKVVFDPLQGGRRDPAVDRYHCVRVRAKPLNADPPDWQIQIGALRSQSDSRQRSDVLPEIMEHDLSGERLSGFQIPIAARIDHHDLPNPGACTPGPGGKQIRLKILRRQRQDPCGRGPHAVEVIPDLHQERKCLSAGGRVLVQPVDFPSADGIRARGHSVGIVVQTRQLTDVAAEEQ